MDRQPINEFSSDSLLFDGFRLLTMRPGNVAYGLLEGHRLWVADGKIAWIGANDPPIEAKSAKTVHGAGKFLSPGLIDCHTHLIYGGNRADEWESRLNGVPYEELARRGGGILATVRATRAATEPELLESAKKRLSAWVRQGVTTVEIKSGYGLDLPTELKMLRVARQLESELPVHVVPTLLGAHAVPPEYLGQADGYIDLVCGEMIPAATGLCDAVDVFCESIAFDLKQTERVFAAAVDAGLRIKVHAEQMTRSGAARLAAEMGALSADHLEYLAVEDCACLAENGTVATLLPGAFYTLLETQRPPVAALREQAVTIAIATDANPGSSPMGSILLAANMACTWFGLTPDESVAGLTRHAAAALGLADEIGTLEVGKRADLAVWDVQSPSELAYGIGVNPCCMVFKSGELTWQVNDD